MSRRARSALGVAVVVGVALGALLVASLVRQASTTLLALTRQGDLLHVDPDAGTRTRLAVAGLDLVEGVQLPRVNPNLPLLVERDPGIVTLVAGTAYTLTTAEGEVAEAVALGEAQGLLPAARPDRVWLRRPEREPRQPIRERQVRVQQVRTDGTATTPILTLPVGYWPRAATDRGLLVKDTTAPGGSDRWALWEPETGLSTPMGITSPSLFVAATPDQLVFGVFPPGPPPGPVLELVDPASGQRRRVTPPEGARFSGVARPSLDGRWLVIQGGALTLVDLAAATAQVIPGTEQATALTATWANRRLYFELARDQGGNAIARYDPTQGGTPELVANDLGDIGALATVR